MSKFVGMLLLAVLGAAAVGETIVVKGTQMILDASIPRDAQNLPLDNRVKIADSPIDAALRADRE